MSGKKLAVVMVLLIAAGGGYFLYKRMIARPAQAPQQGPMPLPVARCIIQDITDFYDFTGTTEAVDSIEIRARVEGYLQGIHFTDGSLVEEGQLLFTIEPEGFAARRDEAAAQLKAAQAQLEQARAELDRIQKAIEANAVSQQDLTRSRAAYDTASASVLAAQAALVEAELNLSYTEIRSPIRGRIGRHLADVGNLVGPATRPVLTTVMRTQPIYVSFYVSESLLKGDLPSRLRGSGGKPISLQVGLPEGGDSLYEGVINYLDNTVDPRTGTVYVRGQLGNEQEHLLPGMFVRVRVPMGSRPNAVLIPEKTIQTDLGGKYVLIVGPGQVLQRRDLVLGASEGVNRIILSGLDGSEMILAGGFYMARPGMPIQPVPAGQMPGGPGVPAASSEPLPASGKP
jgi:RND family efflux transporter MFP subunit